MGRFFPFPIMLIVTLLSACTNYYSSPTQLASNLIQRQTITKTTEESYPIKPTQSISLYTDEKTPHAAYRVIGIASVSKFNLFGKKRPEDALHEMIKKLAASIGGDGLIDIQNNEKELQANVIAYQKILI